MATITTGGSGNWSDGDGVGAWTGTTKPVPGDAVIVADGHVLALDEDASILSLTAAGNTGYCTCAVNVTLTITGTGVAYGGTLTAGFIRVSANTLTITSSQGGATVLVTASAAGYAIVCSAGEIVLSNSGGTAATNSSSGRVVSTSGTGVFTCAAGAITKTAGTGQALFLNGGACSITGNIGCTGGTTYGAAIVYSTLTITGNLSASAMYALSVNGGTTTLAGNCSSSLDGEAWRAVGGTLNWTGAATLAASADCRAYMNSGTVALATASAALALANSGSFVLVKSGGTLTITAAGGTATIVNQAATSYATILGGTDAQKAIISGPTLPDEEDVLREADGGPASYGYAGDPQVGTAESGGPVFHPGMDGGLVG